MIRCTVAKIQAKRLLSGYEIGFKVFSVLFLEHWRLFSVDWRYFGQDTGKNVYSQALKLGLRYLLFYFYKIGRCFASIGGTVAKIWAKMFICWH